MAREFAARGRSLALAARRLDRLETLADELRPSASQVAVSALDVTDVDAVPVVFGKLRDELGGLDRVIVNAGLGKGAPIGTGKAHANIETVQTNLTGALAQAEAGTTGAAAAGDDVGDPVRTVGGDVGDLAAPLLTEGVEEALEGGLVPAGGGPDQPTGVVVDDHGQVAVAALVGDLIDPDPA